MTHLKKKTKKTKSRVNAFKNNQSGVLIKDKRKVTLELYPEALF